ncbi:hypothetical protein [Streptomyces sp. NPDC047315]|uniref:hypothetical protein n=1 Tax=Streptomyces sp. NPDC047315 TaxID=3155142 RepID=UPI0033CE123D
MTTLAIRATLPTVEVLSLLLDASADDSPWAARISEQTGLGKSTVSQILTRLAALTWIVTRNEPGPHPGRPPRILCSLTGEGRRQAKEMLAKRAIAHQRWPRHLAKEALLAEAPTQSDASGPVHPDLSTPQKQPGALRPRFKGLWPVRLSEVEKYRSDKAADAAFSTREAFPVSESDSLARLAELKEAHKALQFMNQQLTTGFIGRSAVAPIHREQHEDVIHLLLMETLHIRGRVLKAHSY